MMPTESSPPPRGPESMREPLVNLAADPAPQKRGPASFLLSRRLSRRHLLGAAALGIVATTGSGGWLYAREPETPWYVTDGPEEVRLSYAFAVEQPEALRHIPCYCGCGEHDGHLSVLDCYVAGRDLFGRPSYDSHGVACPICTAVVGQVRAHLKAGKTIERARVEIDRFFSPYANHATDTPPPDKHTHGQ